MNMSEVGPSCQVARAWQAVVRPGRAGPRSKSRRRLPHPPTGLAAGIVPVAQPENRPGPAPASGIRRVERAGPPAGGSPAGRLEAEVPPGPRGGRPAPRRADDVALAHEVGLGDGLDGVGLLARRPPRGSTGPTGPPPNRRHSASSTARSSRSRPASSTSNRARAAWAASWSTWPCAVHLGPVAHPAQQPVGDARRAPGAARRSRRCRPRRPRRRAAAPSGAGS